MHHSGRHMMSCELNSYMAMKEILQSPTVERKLGRMLATDVGPTFVDARKAYESFLGQWQNQIAAVADLVVRMNTDDAEIAATVHFSAKNLREPEGRQP